MAVDEYEAEYMKGGGRIVHREKTIWKLHWILLFAPIAMFFAAALGLAGVGAHPMPLAMSATIAVIGVLSLVTWAMFISLRVHVTSSEVMIQFGMFGPRIPLAQIDSVAVREYPRLALGGGIKWFDGAWACTLWGQGTRFVRVEWHDASGKKNSTIVWSKDPDALAAKIEEARAARTHVRVDSNASAPSEETDDADESERKEERAK